MSTVRLVPPVGGHGHRTDEIAWPAGPTSVRCPRDLPVRDKRRSLLTGPGSMRWQTKGQPPPGPHRWMTTRGRAAWRVCCRAKARSSLCPAAWSLSLRSGQVSSTQPKADAHGDRPQALLMLDFHMRSEDTRSRIKSAKTVLDGTRKDDRQLDVTVLSRGSRMG